MLQPRTHEISGASSRILDEEPPAITSHYLCSGAPEITRVIASALEQQGFSPDQIRSGTDYWMEAWRAAPKSLTIPISGYTLNLCAEDKNCLIHWSGASLDLKALPLAARGDLKFHVSRNEKGCATLNLIALEAELIQSFDSVKYVTTDKPELLAEIGYKGNVYQVAFSLGNADNFKEREIQGNMLVAPRPDLRGFYKPDYSAGVELLGVWAGAAGPQGLIYDQKALANLPALLRKLSESLHQVMNGGTVLARAEQIAFRNDPQYWPEISRDTEAAFFAVRQMDQRFPGCLSDFAADASELYKDALKPLGAPDGKLSIRHRLMDFQHSCLSALKRMQQYFVQSKLSYASSGPGEISAFNKLMDNLRLAINGWGRPGSWRNAPTTAAGAREADIQAIIDSIASPHRAP